MIRRLLHLHQRGLLHLAPTSIPTDRIAQHSAQALVGEKNVHVLPGFQLKTGKRENVRRETQKFEGVALVHVVRAERWGETSNVHLLTHNFANADTYRCLDSPLCKYAKVTQ